MVCLVLSFLVISVCGDQVTDIVYQATDYAGKWILKKIVDKVNEHLNI